MAAATLFGSAAAEEFTGVTIGPHGLIGIYGNSWGPEFVDNPPPKVFGPDARWEVPLYPPGMARDRKGELAPPSINPNRTGFLVWFSPDLRKVARIIRFGWGLASLSAATVLSDRDIAIAGTGTPNMRALAKQADISRLRPAPREPDFGQIEYEGVVLPGDCYVAKVAHDFSAIRWIWIFEGHRRPPSRIFELSTGSVVFVCRSLVSISADGQSISDIPCTGTPARVDVLGVGAGDNMILVGGARPAPGGTGRESWNQPLLDLYTSDGRHHARFYDWKGSLVGHDAFRLVADSEVSAGCSLADGTILACILSKGPGTVASRDPVDLRRAIEPRGLGTLALPAPRTKTPRVSRLANIVRFHPDRPGECERATWAACTQTEFRSVDVRHLGATRDGRVILAGTSDPFLVQTTLRWFRDPEQYLWQGDYKREGGGIEVTASGWPAYIGLGGRGDFVAVLSQDLRSVLWSSAAAMCRHNAIAEVPGGIVAVSTCTGLNRKDGRTSLFVNHDIAHWTKFLLAVRARAAQPDPSPGRRLWGFISTGLKSAMLTLEPETELSVGVKKRLLYELNKILIDFPNFYDKGSWKKFTFAARERELIALAEAGTIEGKDLKELNRRLLEMAFPKFVFQSPKSNRAPLLNAVQNQFGGGYSDGHVYLIADEPTR